MQHEILKYELTKLINGAQMTAEFRLEMTSCIAQVIAESVELQKKKKEEKDAI